MVSKESPLLKLGKSSDVVVVMGILAIVVMMVIPLPTYLVDLLLVLNMGVALLVLLLTMNVREPLELAVFPTLLLILTLFRLALSISTTRLILLHGDAGRVVEAFGHFVVGGNLVVGLVIFLILVIIQFIVITKGAERVAEVAARFTLDAMPGKQMSIDADLNAGLIDDDTARRRRIEVQREADFYGAMDGASKFVKGDAIAAIIIVLIDILGGFAVGVLQRGLSVEQAISRYTLLTVGDGLVSQIPALLISTATGIIVTRAASDGNLGSDLTKQLLSAPRVLAMTSLFLVVFGFVPGLPTIPFWTLAAIMGGSAYAAITAQERLQEEQEGQPEAEPQAERRPEDVSDLLQTDTVELEIGYGLIPLVDAVQGGDLLERITMIRRQLALELGIVVPAVRIRDNMQLKANEYSIKLHGIDVAKGTIEPGHFLAMASGPVTQPIDGIETREPAFGLPAIWIEDAKRNEAEMRGYTVVDPPSVVATHLTEILRSHAAQLLSRQDTKRLLDRVKEDQQALVDDLVPQQLTLGEVHRVLQGLLQEGVPIRNLVLILESLSDGARVTRDLEALIEIVREGLAYQISQLYSENGVLYAITIDPGTEEEIAQAIATDERGSEVHLSSQRVEELYSALASAVERALARGQQPVILCSPPIRRAVRQLVARALPRIPVVSYREIAANVQVHSAGMVTLRNAG